MQQTKRVSDLHNVSDPTIMIKTSKILCFCMCTQQRTWFRSDWLWQPERFQLLIECRCPTRYITRVLERSRKPYFFSYCFDLGTVDRSRGLSKGGRRVRPIGLTPCRSAIIQGFFVYRDLFRIWATYRCNSAQSGIIGNSAWTHIPVPQRTLRDYLSLFFLPRGNMHDDTRSAVSVLLCIASCSPDMYISTRIL